MEWYLQQSLFEFNKKKKGLKGSSERKAIKFEKKRKVKVVWDKKKKESEKCLKKWFKWWWRIFLFYYKNFLFSFMSSTLFQIYERNVLNFLLYNAVGVSDIQLLATFVLFSPLFFDFHQIDWAFLKKKKSDNVFLPCKFLRVT